MQLYKCIGFFILVCDIYPDVVNFDADRQWQLLNATAPPYPVMLSHDTVDAILTASIIEKTRPLLY